MPTGVGGSLPVWRSLFAPFKSWISLELHIMEYNKDCGMTFAASHRSLFEDPEVRISFGDQSSE